MKKLFYLCLLLFLCSPFYVNASIQCQYKWKVNNRDTTFILETEDNSDVFSKINASSKMVLFDDKSIKLAGTKCPQVSVHYDSTKGVSTVFKNQKVCKDEALTKEGCSEDILGSKVEVKSPVADFIGNRKLKLNESKSKSDTCIYHWDEKGADTSAVTITVQAKRNGQVDLNCNMPTLTCTTSGQENSFYVDGVYQCPKYIHVEGAERTGYISYKIASVSETGNASPSDSSNTDEEAEEEWVAMDGCTALANGTTIHLLNDILGYLQLAAVVILLVFGGIDFIGAIASGDDGALYKATKRFFKRVMAGVLVFLIPALVSIVLAIANRSETFCGLLGGTISNSGGSSYNGGAGQDGDSSGAGGAVSNKNEKTVTQIRLNKQATAIGTHFSDNKVKLEIQSIQPEDAKNKKVTWSVVKGEQYVKVDQRGNVTGQNGGTAVVRATSVDNPKVYAECKITVMHSLYENVVATKDITAKLKYSNQKVSIKKNQKLILHGIIRRLGNMDQNEELTVQLSDGKLALVKRKYLKFKSYYIDNPYGNSIYEEYINNAGYQSKTKYLIWVNQGTQRLILFERVNQKWKVRENFKSATGDVEKNNGMTQSFLVDLEVQDFYGEKKVATPNPPVDPTQKGVMIHVKREGSKNRLGNTIHVVPGGKLPKNTAGGNSNVTRPVSHGCPNITAKDRDTLWEKYNKKTKDELIGSRVLYF